MLVIRKKQIEEMKRAMFDDFVRRMVQRARRRHPEKSGGMDDEKLHDIVSEEIAYAREAGLTLKGHMKRYLDISFTLSPGFGKEPWARDILFDPESIPAAKLHNLEREALFRPR
jgi:hypothetical protein